MMRLILFSAVFGAFCSLGQASQIGEEFAEIYNKLKVEQSDGESMDAILTMIVNYHEVDISSCAISLLRDKDGRKYLSLISENEDPRRVEILRSDDDYFRRWFRSFFAAKLVDRLSSKDPFPSDMGGVGYYFRIRKGDEYIWYFRQDFDSLRRLDVSNSQEEDIDFQAEQALCSMGGYLLGRSAGLK